MTTILFLILMIAGFAALVRATRHDRFSARPSTAATLFGKLGQAAHDPHVLR